MDSWMHLNPGGEERLIHVSCHCFVDLELECQREGMQKKRTILDLALETYISVLADFPVVGLILLFAGYLQPRTLSLKCARITSVPKWCGQITQDGWLKRNNLHYKRVHYIPAIGKTELWTSSSLQTHVASEGCDHELFSEQLLIYYHCPICLQSYWEKQII